VERRRKRVKSYLKPKLSCALVLMAVGAMGTSVFTKDFTIVHGAVSSMTFLFGGLARAGII
jgi:hypothetical protein